MEGNAVIVYARKGGMYTEVMRVQVKGAQECRIEGRPRGYFKTDVPLTFIWAFAVLRVL